MVEQTERRSREINWETPRAFCRRTVVSTWEEVIATWPRKNNESTIEDLWKPPTKFQQAPEPTKIEMSRRIDSHLTNQAIYLLRSTHPLRQPMPYLLLITRPSTTKRLKSMSYLPRSSTSPLQHLLQHPQDLHASKPKQSSNLSISIKITSVPLSLLRHHQHPRHLIMWSTRKMTTFQPITAAVTQTPRSTPKRKNSIRTSN